jgi:hypothetical protein
MLAPFKFRFIMNLLKFFISYPAKAIENAINVQRLESMSNGTKEKPVLKSNRNEAGVLKRHLIDFDANFEAGPRVNL